MAAEGFPVARIDEYAKPCEPAIHVLRSVEPTGRSPGVLATTGMTTRSNGWSLKTLGI